MSTLLLALSRVRDFQKSPSSWRWCEMHRKWLLGGVWRGSGWYIGQVMMRVHCELLPCWLSCFPWKWYPHIWRRRSWTKQEGMLKEYLTERTKLGTVQTRNDSFAINHKTYGCQRKYSITWHVLRTTTNFYRDAVTANPSKHFSELHVNPTLTF